MNKGMVRFDGRKAMRRFADIVEFLPEDERNEFSSRVAELSDKKIISEEGEYTEFVITIKDMDSILESMKK